MDLERTLFERNTYQAALSKAENQGSNTEEQKTKLEAELKKVSNFS